MTKSLLTAKSHAYLFTAIAKTVIDAYGEEGKTIIKEGVIHYGKQRGQRMRQRTIRDGFEPNGLNYIVYGEWIAAPGDMDIDVASYSPDIEFLFKKCPWHDIWSEKGLLANYGYLYCQYVDEAIGLGYNPDMIFDILSTRGCGASVCDMRMRNQNVNAEELEDAKLRIAANGNKYKRGWSFHCAHLYKSLWEIVVARLGLKGILLMTEALQNFNAEYGAEASEEFLQLVNLDFNVAD